MNERHSDIAVRGVTSFRPAAPDSERLAAVRTYHRRFDVNCSIPSTELPQLAELWLEARPCRMTL